MPSAYDFYDNNGYQRIFNNHGYNSMNRGINMPQPDLAIGYAEVTSSIPLKVSYAPILKQPDVSPVVSVDDTFVKTKGAGLRIDSFTRSGYVGEAIGGF